MNSFICERCEREEIISYRCDRCHRQVCRDCITSTSDAQYLCLDCYYGKEPVRINEPEPVPA